MSSFYAIWNRYLLEDVEEPNANRNQEMNMILSNVRVMVPIYRRHMLIGIVSNIIYSSIVILMMYMTGNNKLVSYSLLLTILLYVTLTLNFAAAFCKFFIILFGNHMTDPRLTHRKLRENVKKFMSSRVYFWAKVLGKYLFYINFFQFVISIFYLVVGNLNLAVFSGIFMSAFFLVRIGTNIYELQDLIQKEMDEGSLEEVVKTMRNETNGKMGVVEGDCVICFENMQERERVLCLTCPSLHPFHEECIRGWLVKSLTCPICKAFV